MMKAFAVQNLLALSLASQDNCTFDSISPSKDLVWCPCSGGFLCAKLDVPLDYQNLGLGRAAVPLLKIPAQTNSSAGPYQGMLLINPGGPGGSGITEALSNGSDIQAVLGTNWDVVGFDPRGIGLSEPLANCSHGLDRNETSQTRRRSVPRLSDEYYESFIEYGKELGERCEALIGGSKDAGPHMTTAVTARDMLSIVDAFALTNEGKTAAKSDLLNYYGISYGSFLGQTFASMYPQRVGRVAVDGIVSPQGYLNHWTSPAVLHLDGVIALFFIYCHEAGATACPFYTGSTPRDIFERFNESFVQLDARKAADCHWSNATEIESALVALKLGMLTAVDNPQAYFSYISDVFLGLEEALAAHDLPKWTQQLTAIIGDPSPAGYVNPEWTLGVLCSDQNDKLYGKDLRYLEPAIHQLEQQSIIGEIWTHSVLACTGWPIKSKDTFAGPFGGETATPMLFVSNTYDPITPINNGQSSVLRYKNAQLLTVDGMGHTSTVTGNLCAFGKVRDYFQNTQLPGPSAFCPLEKGPFDITLNGTLLQNIERAGLTNLH